MTCHVNTEMSLCKAVMTNLTGISWSNRNLWQVASSVYNI